jgi:Holliday junction resolvase
MDQVAPEFFIEEKERRETEARGADRERSRIRRAQAKALRLIRSPNSGMTRDYYADIIDAATRAPRKR